MIKNKKYRCVLTEKTIPTCSRCEKNPQQEEHYCPFQLEINDDENFLCDCCDECTHECAMDI